MQDKIDWSKMDRRRFARIKYPCLVTIRKNTAPELAILTHTKDISEGGVCVAIWEKIEVMTEVNLVIDLLDTLPPIISKGVAKWIKMKEDASDQRGKSLYNVGIQFTGLKDEYRRRVQDIVDNQLGKKSQ